MIDFARAITASLYDVLRFDYITNLATETGELPKIYEEKVPGPVVRLIEVGKSEAVALIPVER